MNRLFAALPNLCQSAEKFLRGVKTDPSLIEHSGLNFLHVAAGDIRFEFDFTESPEFVIAGYGCLLACLVTTDAYDEHKEVSRWVIDDLRISRKIKVAACCARFKPTRCCTTISIQGTKAEIIERLQQLSVLSHPALVGVSQ